MQLNTCIGKLYVVSILYMVSIVLTIYRLTYFHSITNRVKMNITHSQGNRNGELCGTFVHGVL